MSTDRSRSAGAPNPTLNSRLSSEGVTARAPLGAGHAFPRGAGATQTKTFAFVTLAQRSKSDRETTNWNI